MSLADFIKIPWNKYEAVLLVDAYLKCCAGVLSKEQAVSQLSQRLRHHMEKMGVPISNAYRNESGISLQMSSIEYLFTNGECGISHTSNLFRETVELYLDKKEAFYSLLEIANSKYEPVVIENNTSTVKTARNLIGDVQQPSVNDVSQHRYASRKLRELLVKRFPKGYRLGSFVEVSRLKKFFKEEYGEELDMELKDIDEDVKSCGIEYDGRVYLPELILPAQIKDDLLSYINSYFEKGGTIIFYSVLYLHFKDLFLDSHILNDGMLREYLEYINTGEWYFFELYFSQDKDATINIIDEVVEYVKEQGGAVSEDEVVIGLSYYPEQLIREAFDERNTSLVSCGRNLRFHIDNFVITNRELAAIENIIRKAISNYKFITFNELLKDMKMVVPNVIDNNLVYTEIGIRNALFIKLHSKFSFYNSIISSTQHPIRSEDAFMEIAKRPHYTMDDVKALAESCGSLPNLYLEPMLRYSVRVDKDNFVANSKVHFDVDAVDNVLLRICTGDFIALSDVTMLSTLPDCEYKWTPFLLECYVAFYSAAFGLIHNKYFGQANATGGIVKRNSNIRDFNTLAALAVVEAGIPLEKKAVLQFLSDKSYIVQRRYEDIDEVLSKAAMISRKNV